MAHTDKFQRLNEEFYAANPSTYFRDRLLMLVLGAANPNLIEENVSEGTAWGVLRAVALEQPDAALKDAAEKEAEHSRFLVAESQVLLHHAAEALLRMFLAHERNPECPWLEIAAFKDAGKFREALTLLARRTWSRDRMNTAGWVFLGSIPNEPSDEWTELRDAAVRLLRILASHVNDDSQLYNAAKHGFTALAGTGSLHFLATDPTGPSDGSGELTAARLERDAVLGADGVNIAYLERSGTRKSGYTWRHQTRWLTPERDAYLAQLAILQMEGLWRIARCHYLDEPAPTRVQLVTKEALDAWRDFPRTGSVQSWGWTIGTEPGSSGAPVEGGETAPGAPLAP
jgi:hypothetical protein